LVEIERDRRGASLNGDRVAMLTTWSARAVRSVAVGAAALLLAGCPSSNGPFVWAQDYAVTPTGAEGAYTIGVGDMLNVQVYDNDKLSTRARVRADGKISVPLISDVSVEGKSPNQLAREIEQTLKTQNLVLSPRVNVVVEEVPPIKVSVLGAVSRAGTYSVDRGSGLAEVLASAGGLTEFAHKDQIYVLRKTPEPVRIRFTFESLVNGPSAAAAFRLQNGDVVVAK
jgi:polysaccharide export outer membrane protein